MKKILRIESAMYNISKIALVGMNTRIGRRKKYVK